MDVNQLWSWFLSAVGIAGFFLAGKKVWWAWYVNLLNQFVWTAYAIATEQWGFIIASAFYFAVFSRNAYLWTNEHRLEKWVKRTGGTLDEWNRIPKAFIPKQGDQPKGGAGDSGASKH